MAASVADVVACAEWMHRLLPHWIDPDLAVDLADVSRSIAAHLTCVSAFAEKGGCLPVKAALRVQSVALDCWNASAVSAWSPERRDLKVQVRWLITHLFLCGHCVFAAHAVREAHLSRRLRDAEKCILMCLKTGSGLLRSRRHAEAERVLAWAADVASACTNATGAATVRRFATEVQFAQLRAAWAAGAHDRACATAEALGEETRSSVTYREALYEFVYDVAVESTQLRDAPPHSDGVADADQTAADTDDDDGDDDGDAVGAPPSCALSEAASRQHAALQRLLVLSARLQQETGVRTVKQRSFLGMTHLQHSNSLLLCCSFAAAADAATRAYDLLRTYEPLVVRIKAEAHLRHADEVATLFHLLCDDVAVDVSDVCAVVSVAVELVPAAEATLFAGLQRRVAASDSTADVFRLLCALIRRGSEWSVAELLRHLAAGAVLPAALRRFLFCCLWRLAAAAPAAPRCLSAATRWGCLEAAQRLFLDAASAEELQAVLLDMAHLALAAMVDEEAGAATELLTRTAHLYTTVSDAGPAMAVPALRAQAQLAFVLGRQEEGMARMRTLLAVGGAERAVVHECTAMVTFLMHRSLLQCAGAVAELCLVALPRDQRHQQPSCALEFARVFAVGCLASDAAAADGVVRADVAEVLHVHVCPVLQDASLAPEEARWWSRFLWYVAESLLDVDLVRAVRLLHAGMQLHTHQLDDGVAEEVTCSAAREDVQLLTLDRLCTLLDAEFDVFAAGHAALAAEEVQQYTDQLAGLLRSHDGEDGSAAPACERRRVALVLARLEGALRVLQGRGAATPEDVESLRLADLPTVSGVCSADLQQAAAACSEVAASLPPATASALCDAAVGLLLIAAQYELCGDDASGGSRDTTSVEALAAVLTTLYTAFQVAHDVEARLRVGESLAAVLTRLTAGGVTLRSAFAQQRAAAAAPEEEEEKQRRQCRAVERGLDLCETVVEFFAVEAWNESVQWNVLQRRALVERWRGVAAVLTAALDDTNASKAAIADFAVQMPLL
ncbi:hypothetical protein NESM_000547300 [Novymonas esmeraldas]|uniref:Uncharacterized protein n=1 Tax=Novymonas esmeraldas TaxID=1808958 RepID=A0AAW0ESU2_9TRYP